MSGNISPTHVSEKKRGEKRKKNVISGEFKREVINKHEQTVKGNSVE